MKFYRTREWYANGPCDWDYHIYPYGSAEDIAPEELEEIRLEIAEQRSFQYEDSFRGLDIEEVKNPPKDWLENQVEIVKGNAQHFIELAEKLQRFLDEKYE